jgi:hypothetical protein
MATLTPVALPAGTNPRFTLYRRVVRVCYARNGNVNNPTHQYAWDLYLNGNRYMSFPRKREAVEEARKGLVEEG